MKAIVVYPMNALANSQVGELEKFLRSATPRRRAGHVRPLHRPGVPRRARRILADPPDILLTNYVMLELVLTRPDERKQLVRAAQGLRFLVLDELHTYRGRQGADVAMLVRRLRDQCACRRPAGHRHQRHDVERGHARRNGVRWSPRWRPGCSAPTVTPERVIGETLVRATPDSARRRIAPMPSRDAAAPRSRTTYDELASDPLAAWIETTSVLTSSPDTGRLVRRAPTTVPTLPPRSSPTTTGLTRRSCRAAIRNDPAGGSRVAPSRQRAAVVRVPAAPVPLQGRHRLRLPRARGRPPHHRRVPGPRPGSARQGAAAARASAASAARSTWSSPRQPGTGGRSSCPAATPTPAAATPSPATSMSLRPAVARRPAEQRRLPDPGWSPTRRRGHVEVLDSKRKYLPDKLSCWPDGSLDAARRRPARRGSCPPRSRSACAAVSRTSRSAATTSASSPPWTPRAAPAR